MKTNRRGLLKLVLSGAAALLVQANGFSGTLKNSDSSSKSSTGPAKVLLASSNTKDAPMNRISLTPEEFLYESYFPLLKLNEGERCDFYRCSAGNVTVGYGTNVQIDPNKLNGTNIYHNNKKLTPAQKKTFLANMTKIDEVDLNKYTINSDDAEKLARTDALKMINYLKQKCTNPNTKKSYFSDLPICMQIMALDVCYNVRNFDEYKKFREGLMTGNYAQATKESKVNIKKEDGTKITNKGRELRKQRSFIVMNIVRENYPNSPSNILKLVAQNHENANLNEEPANREANLKIEATLAICEYIRCEMLAGKCSAPTKENLTSYIQESQEIVKTHANQYKIQRKKDNKSR